MAAIKIVIYPDSASEDSDISAWAANVRTAFEGQGWTLVETSDEIAGAWTLTMPSGTYPLTWS
jgi:phage protein U